MEKRVMAGAVAATLLIAPIAVQLTLHNREPMRGALIGGVGTQPGETAEADLRSRSKDETIPPSTTASAELVAPLPGIGQASAPSQAPMPMPSGPTTALDAVAPATEGLSAPPIRAYRQALENGAMQKQALGGHASAVAPLAAHPQIVDGRAAAKPGSRDNFESFDTNPLKLVAQEPVSTFSIDVDTASYAFTRRMLQQGSLPPAEAIRVEEMINYFPYDYPRPESAEVPFRTSVAVYPTPWNTNTRLIHIGIKGYDLVPAELPRSNLVFLVDVSGSMSSSDKLPLLKSAFRLLIDRLNPDDTISIVTYAGRAGTALEPTKVSDRTKILEALGRLEAGGSTAGEQGIRQAYALAEQAFVKDGVNRIMLATDGDFNIGISDIPELKRYIGTKRQSGIFLSVLGFGQGNYNDALMQALAQNGNGTAAYIDTLSEARKVLVEEAGSTLFPIAKDVKIQIEFNPATVSEYRLIGYETRSLRREDFNDDRVDAGDIGSGHAVTALYEITPRGSVARLVNALRYQPAQDAATGGSPDEYAFLKVRYKLPDQDTSRLITVPVSKALDAPDVGSLNADMKFAAAVAAFGQKLRGDIRLEDYSYDRIADLAQSARGQDHFGHRSEFINLVRLARALSGTDSGSASGTGRPK